MKSYADRLQSILMNGSPLLDTPCSAVAVEGGAAAGEVVSYTARLRALGVEEAPASKSGKEVSYTARRRALGVEEAPASKSGKEVSYTARRRALGVEEAPASKSGKEVSYTARLRALGFERGAASAPALAPEGARVTSYAARLAALQLPEAASPPVPMQDAMGRYAERLAALRASGDPLLQALAPAEAPAAVASRPVSTPAPRPGAVAIIGMAGRFPGADDVEGFWRNVRAGRSTVREVPPERWRADEFYDPDPARKDRSISKWAGFLDGIDGFDPGFFGISPREAACMDPQQRLFLEQAWLALEDAGYARERVQGKVVGVYAGALHDGYDRLIARSADARDAYAMLGNTSSLLAARISYFLDFHGPAITLDTACSSSMVAIDLACRDLLQGETEMAIAGGVNVFLDEQPFLLMSQAGVLSPEGRCKSFDDSADGITVGEAAVALLLKPLERALADGDPVRAVILASGTNQDGRTNGITAPSPKAQAALIRKVLERAGVHPRSIGMVEAHGTGTRLGDPIEVAALKEVFQERTQDRGFCALGSVKSNIGHSSAAAGACSIVKATLCLERRSLAPTLHIQRPNRLMSIEESPFTLVTACRPWEASAGQPRRAAVSSFGMSGTNAHVLLEEAPPPPPRPAPGAEPWSWVTVSARTQSALSRRCDELAVWLEGEGRGARWDDLVHTLNLGRSDFEHRLALVVRQVDELPGLLREAARGGSPEAVFRSPPAPDPAQDPEAQDEMDREVEAFAQRPPREAGERRRALRALARLYAAGAQPAWEKLHPPASARIVSVPRYPFERRSCWAARRPGPPGAPPVPAAAEREEASPAEPSGSAMGSAVAAFAQRGIVQEPRALPPVVMMEARWQPRGAVGAPPALAAQALILAPVEDEGLLALLERASGAAEQIVVRYGPGAVGAPDGLSADDPSAWAALAARLRPGAAIWMAVSGRPPDEQALDAWCDAVEEEVLVLLRLARSVASALGPDAAVQLTIVAVDTFPVLGTERLRPAAAATLGLGKALGQEFSRWQVRLVDMHLDDLAENGVGLERLAETLAREPGDPSGEPICLRQGRRWVRVLGPVDDVGGEMVPLRQGGVWLITGGMGRLGRVLSRHLARTRCARLLLVGRSPASDEHRAFLEELRELGGQARYCRADVADQASLEAAFQMAEGAWGALDGVIHAAVDPVFARVPRVIEREFREALQAKIRGGVALHELGRRHGAALHLCFSSLGAFARFPGNVGQSSYAAACSFEGAWTDWMRLRAGHPARVVYWGVWEDPSFRPERLTAIRAQGIYPFAVDAGLAAFERWLSLGISQVACAALAPAVWRALGASLSPAGFAEALNAAAKEPEVADAALERASAWARGLLLQALRERGLLARAPGARAPRAALFDEGAARLPRHAPLLAALCDLLNREGMIRAEGDDVVVTPLASALVLRERLAELDREQRALEERWPALSPLLLLIRQCISGLPRVLAGTCQATDLLFPGGKMDLVEAVYRRHPALRAWNQRLAAALGAAAARLRDAGPVRVLELGAGTGTATEVLLGALGAGDTYLYTDLSPAFVEEGKRRLGQDAGRRFQVLDLEQDLLTQGLEPGSMDLVVAANALHVAVEPVEALRRVLAVLRPGGLLLFHVPVQVDDAWLLSFGLLDAWWRCAVPGPLGLSLRGSEVWSTLAEDAGFAPVEIVASSGVGGLRHALVVAARPAAIEEAATQPAPSARPVAEAADPPTDGAPASGGSADAGRLEAILAVVRAKVAEALDLDPGVIDPRRPYAELGVDSIIAPQIAEAISAALSVRLRSTDLFNYATLAALSRYIDKQLAFAPLPGPAAKAPPRLTPTGPAEELPTPAHRAPAAVAAVGRGAEPIAIVGMSGRFPGAPDLRAYWRMLAEGRSPVREVPPERLDLARYHAPWPGRPGKTYARWGAFLEDFDRFDPLFFNISPAEAEVMDPQQRLFLEEAWRALEDAGCTQSSLDETRCGVFVGVSANNYRAPGSPSLRTLGGSVAILAARLPYYLNLRGPCYPVDTACSSSLVAVHLACQSLRAGECELAVAGGVACNLISADIFLYIADNRMAAADGRCKTFDDTADGFVPAEGVGVLVLKRLADAQRDGDRIHAVILGSGVNQDGTTSGITAPSAAAQTALEREVYARSGVDAATIGLVEAHGTGTRLGDPIEISALTDAFAPFDGRERRCLIGSVKTNIGHAMAAAGIAGLLKVILALQHRKVPPSLHFERPNRHIDFVASPFEVPTSLRAWESAAPRRAAVSSFGFSGTNAHLVVEEAPPPALIAAPAPGPAVVAVSARGAESLEQRLRDLAAWLRGEGEAAPFNDICHTLNQRRTHFPRSRAAFVAASNGALASAIEARLSGRRGPEAPPRLSALAQAYEAGDAEAERALQGGSGGRLVSLPGYPFARERYWHPQDDSPATAMEARLPLHPLLDERIAVPGGAEYVSTLTAEHWLLAQHAVDGRNLLPGVVFLEMARAGGEQHAGRAVTRIGEVTWVEPLVLAPVGAPRRVVVRLAEEAGRLVCSLLSGPAGGEQVHARASVDFAPVPAPAPIALTELATRFGAWEEAEPIYARFSAVGYQYGPGLRGIERMALAPSEALARLRIPAAAPRPAGLKLHPALLDAAFQAAAGAAVGNEQASRQVPFALEALTLHREVPEQGWVHARRRSPAGPLLRFDLTLVDDQGRPCVTVDGLTARPWTAAPAPDPLTWLRPRWRLAGRAPSAPALAPAAGPRLFLVSPVEAPWAQRVARADRGDAVVELALDDRSVGGRPSAVDQSREASFVHLLTALPEVAEVWFCAWSEPGAPFDGAALVEAEERGVLSLFRLLRALLHAPSDARPARLRVLTRGVQGVLPDESIDPRFGAISGLVRTFAHEHPPSRGLAVDLLDLPPLGQESDHDEAAALVFAAGQPTEETMDVAYRGGLRLERAFERLAPPVRSEALPLRENGVYVLLGGAGGIGLELALWLSRRCRARLLLVGRRPEAEALGAAGQAKLQAIREAGGEARYAQADGAAPGALAEVVETARQAWGAVHGAIHTAMVLRDRTLLELGEDALREALRPKTAASLELHRALRGQPLDFLAFFSAANAFAASPGQGSYAAASTFQDAFARHLGQRGGTRVVLLNWGFWGDVGVVASAQYHRRLAAQGVGPISVEEGMDAFARALSAREEQLLVLKPLASEIPFGAPMRSVTQETASTFTEVASALRARVDVPPPDIALAEAEMAALNRRGVEVLRQLWPRIEGEPVAPRHERLAAVLGILVTSAPAGGASLAESGGSLAPLRALLDACLEALPAVLSGRRSAASVLFPGGSMERVEAVYRGNPASDYFNGLLADAVAAQMRALGRAGRPLRVLEVGAGTGSATAAALAVLAPMAHSWSWCSTDVSPSFLAHGERRFSGAGDFSFRLLDISRDPLAQGFTEGSFDLVVASNVLHATADVRQAVMNAKRLLARGGLLLLNEVTWIDPFATLTFGLTDGWWAFTDPERRLPGGPLLCWAGWRALLGECGFGPIYGAGARGEGSEAQNVFVACSDGWIEAASIAPRVPSEEAPALAARPVAAAPLRAARPDPEGGAEEALRSAVEAYLKRVIAGLIKLDPGRIDADDPFSRYGIDSVMILQFNTALERDLGPIPSTLFFEHDSIAHLASYLCAERAAACRAHLGLALEAPVEAAPAATPEATVEAQAAASASASTAARAPQVAPISMPAARAARSQDVAIIGMSGVYPQAPDLDVFWDNLREGRDCITDIPPERWPLAGFYDPDRTRPDTSYSRWGGFIEGADLFDPLFFKISPKEAEALDPQVRKFLEHAWLALEDAGYTRATLFERSPRRHLRLGGVFAAVMNGDYQLFGVEEAVKGNLIGPNAAYWNIANRASWFLDLCGPSMAVDTACSSSLTALHLACQSLRDGDCEVALVGGVNLSLHPRKYLALAQAGFASSDGRCRSFGAGGDGFVPGEGVGMLLLKPLARALEDDDPIHAVIRGSAINHGGATHGYTVPDPRAQAAVISTALQRAEVDPATVSYVEAHGTGTALGDPVELSGLCAAFAGCASASCAIGSVKSNVGHLESAAGVAGITKVVLQMRHRLLVPSLHAEVPNPKLDLGGSPFRIQTSLAPWARPLHPGPDGTLRPVPRRAGISSFGAGGASAHVVLEEPPPAPVEVDFTGDCLLSLSSASQAQVREYAGRIARALRRSPASSEGGYSLASVARTLQVGREEMPSRAALVVRTLDEAVATLEALAGGQDPVSVHWGQIDPGLGQRPVLAKGEAGLRVVRALLREGDLGSVAALWAQGAPVPWAELYPRSPSPRRVSLPGYPFARRRCWIRQLPPLRTPGASLLPAAAPEALAASPVLWRLAADHPLLADHDVDGVHLLPGVAALEAVRRAEEAAGRPASVGIRALRWLRPLCPRDGILVLAISLAQGVAPEFVIRDHDGVEATRGQVLAEVPPPPPPVDLAAVRARCGRVASGAEVYAALAEAGLRYGPTFRRLVEVRAGESEAVASLTVEHRLPEEDTGLPVPTLDAALQISFALVPSAWAGRRLLPFSVDEVRIYGRPSGLTIAVARRVETGKSHVRLDLELCAPEGTVLVRFLGVVLKEVPAALQATPTEIAPLPSAAEGDAPLRLLRPGWRQQPLPAKGTEDPGRVLVVAPPATDGLAEALVAALPGAVRCEPGEIERSLQGETRFGALIFLGAWPCSEPELPTVEALEGVEARSILGLYRAWRALVSSGALASHPRLRLQVITANMARVGAERPQRPIGAAVVAMARALGHEHPLLGVSCVDLDLEEWRAGSIRCRVLLDELSICSGVETAYRRGQRYERSLEEVQAPAGPPPSPFRRGGVYILLGGAGGLGLALAEHLATRAAARLLLVGRRRPADASIDAALRRLSRAGAEVRYRSGDASDPRALQDILAEARRAWGPIDGIVHAALDLRDARLAEQAEADVRAVLAPKVRGLAALTEALLAEPAPPGLLLFFSSACALTANPGQAAYAAASACEDAWALELGARLGCRVRVIDWGMWGEVGRVADPAYHRALGRIGLLPLTTAEGLAVVDQVVAGPLEQVVALRARADLLRALGVTGGVSVAFTAGSVPSVLDAVGEAATRATGSARALDHDAAVRTRVERLARDGLLRTLQQRGLLLAPGQPIDLTSLRQRLGSTDEHGRLVDALVDVLVRSGFAARRGDAVEGAEILGSASLQSRLDAWELEVSALEQMAGGVAPYVALLRRCLQGLPAVLSGRVRASEVLFPGGSTAAVEGIYRGNALVDHFQELSATCVREAIARWSARLPGERLRILEVGAGTGGTTAFVLPALQPFADRVEYWYTDLSPGFLHHGERQFLADHPFLRFARFDVERPVEEQGLTPGSFHLVIAANVLHATRDIGQTLNTVAALCAGGGLLVLSEATSVQDVTTLTFGLTPGWWRFQDGQRRIPHSPLLELAGWRDALASAGFRGARGFGLPVTPGGPDLLQCVILAEASGVFMRSSRAPAQEVETLVRAAPARSAAPAPRPLAPSTAAGDRRQILEALVVAHVSESLHLERAEVDRERSFFDYGADSIVGVDLVRKLGAALGVELGVTTLFSHPTIRDLVLYLLEEHGSRLRLPGETAPALVPPEPSPHGELPARGHGANSVNGAAPERAPSGRERLGVLLSRMRPVNRESEFWSKETRHDGQPAAPPSPPREDPLTDLLRQLASGELDLATALAQPSSKGR